MNPAALSSVLGRISQIETAFAPRESAPNGAIPAPTAQDADLFGEAYQAAVAAARRATVGPTDGAVASASGSMLRRGTALPGVRIADDVIASAIDGRLAAPGALRIGGYGSLAVPPELSGFGNGRVPSTALVELRAHPGHRLHAPAAASWDRLVDAAAADGVDMRITDSYRSYAEQVDLAERKGLYVDGGLAATPGRSNHGWGLAVDADVNDPRVLEWLRTHGPRFGWVEAVPREPWHWEFRPEQVGST